MAENSVTIALKLDTSQFNAELSKIKKDLGNVGIAGVRSSGGGGKGTVKNPLSEIAKIDFGPLKASAKKQESWLSKVFGVNEKTAAQSVAIMKGNFSAANTMGVMEGILGGMSGALGALVLIAAAVVIGITMLQTALKPIMIVLGAIGKILGAALMPIAMVIVTLLQPLMILLMPLVRILRAIFQPLQSRIRAFFSGQGKEMLKSGDYAGFALAFIKQVGIGLVESFIVLFGEIQKLMLDGFGVILQSLVSLFFSPLKVMVSIIGALLYAIPGVPESVHQSIKDLSTNLDNMEASIKKGIVESIQWAKDKIDDNVKGILAIIQTIDPLNKKDMTPFNKTVDDTIAGLDKLNNYGKPTAPGESPAKGGGTFGPGMSMMDITGMYLPGGKLGPKFYPGGTDMPGGQISTEGLGEPAQTRSLLDKIFGTDGVIARGISETRSIVSGIIRNDDDSVFNRMQKGLSAIKAMVHAQIETDPDSLKAVILTGFIGIIDWFKVNLGFLQMLMSSIGRIFAGIPQWVIDMLLPKKVKDVVITPGGQVIETSPQDYLFATKDPGSLMGGGGVSTTINITVQGNVDDKTARFITDTVQREIAQQWRAIAR